MGESILAGDRGEVTVFENGEELATSLAYYVAQVSEEAVRERGAFAIVLSGGSLINSLRFDWRSCDLPKKTFFAGFMLECTLTGRNLGQGKAASFCMHDILRFCNCNVGYCECRKLSEAPYLKTMDWARWHVFWADEKVVAKTHPHSNYKQAKEALFSKVPIIPSHVYSINDSLSAETAAQDYEFGLRQLVKTRIVDVSKSNDCPKFDLILLRMGADGHVASLFPNHPVIDENEQWITFITDSPKPPPERITFSLPVINSAANVVIVVTGANKAKTLERALGERLPHCTLPVQMVLPKEGRLTWFADNDAASKLVRFGTVSPVS